MDKQLTPQAKIVLNTIKFSRFGAMSQIFVIDALMKAGHDVEHRKGEYNEQLVTRMLKAQPNIVADIQSRCRELIEAGAEKTAAEFKACGADKWMNPAAWHGAAVELGDKLGVAA